MPNLPPAPELQLSLDRTAAPRAVHLFLGCQRTPPHTLLPPEISVPILAGADSGSTGWSLQSSRGSLSGFVRAWLPRDLSIPRQRLRQEAQQRQQVGCGHRLRLMPPYLLAATLLHLLLSSGGSYPWVFEAELHDHQGRVWKRRRFVHVPAREHPRLLCVCDCVRCLLPFVLLEGSLARDQQGLEGSDLRARLRGSLSAPGAASLSGNIGGFFAGRHLLRRRCTDGIPQRAVLHRRGGEHFDNQTDHGSVIRRRRLLPVDSRRRAGETGGG